MTLTPDPTHEWEGQRCKKCGAYKHLGSGYLPCRPPQPPAVWTPEQLASLEEMLGKVTQPPPKLTAPPATGKIDPVWPSEKLAKEMANDCCAPDMNIHILALLQRVRTLERALQATGFFGPPGDSEGWWAKWRESVEYTCEADALLDAFHVPTQKDGKPLYLKERIELLGLTANRRSRLAYDLFTQLDQEYGDGLKNGYWAPLRPLWDRCKEEFDAKQNSV